MAASGRPETNGETAAVDPKLTGAELSRTAGMQREADIDPFYSTFAQFVSIVKYSEKTARGSPNVWFRRVKI
jgi:hypothetical protein